MNAVYRIVWSHARNAWVAVCEFARSMGKSSSTINTSALTAVGLLAVASLAQAAPPAADALPTGGQIVAGQGAIAQSGNAMTVTQNTQKLIANWQSFDIGKNASVTFNQPNASSVALNRITGQSPSQIFGSLSANGQVMLVNPSGIVFGQGSQVNVGSLVASTLNLSDQSFLAGNYRFSGTGTAEIVNQGNITANGGVVALIAPVVKNEGSIHTPQGSTVLVAGNDVSVDFTGDGLISYTIEQGAVDALVANKGLIKADGGLVVMTAKAANSLTSAVVNNSGVVEAQTLASKGGRILLLADMAYGETLVGGKLDASAPNGGDGGFIETSAAKVTVEEGVQITSAAPNGITGEWLIDPVNITIAASGGNVTGATIATALLTTDVTLDTSGTGSCTVVACTFSGANGDIFVNDNIAVVDGLADTTLTLKANRDIKMNAATSITRTGSYKLNTILWSDSDATSGGAIFIDRANINSNGGNITLSGGTDLSTGYAQGRDGVANFSNGISILGASLQSGGGDITLRGSASAASASSDSSFSLASIGVLIGTSKYLSSTATLLDSGSGKILINGLSNASTSDDLTRYFNAVAIGYETTATSSASVTLRSANVANDAIRIVGDASGLTRAGSTGDHQGVGVLIDNTISGRTVAVEAMAGGIVIDGKATQQPGFQGEGFRINSYQPNIAAIVAAGPINITGQGKSGNSFGNDIRIRKGIIGYANATGVSSSSGNITFNCDTLDLADTPLVQSTGTFTIQPRTAGTTISIVDETGTLRLPAIYFSDSFTNGFSGITIGNATAGAITVGGATTFKDSTTLLNNSTIAINGAVTANENLVLTGNGAITQSAALAVTGTTVITAGAANDITLNHASNNFTGAVSVSSGKDVSLIDSNAMTLGAINATGLVDVATLTNDLTVTGNIATTNTLASAIKLNAGKNSAAGTATGGNIIVSGGSLSYGTGGSATLYSGSVANSTGLTALVGSASGRFRYNSDEAASNFTDVLAAGTNAIYREKPTLTVTPDTATITYGDAPPVLASTIGSGYVNGDASAGTISGTSTWTIGGSISTSGKLVAGTHEVSYNDGLVSSLGYGFTDNGASSNELTVNKKDLNVSGLTVQNKVYDATPTATLGGAAAVTALGSDVVAIAGTASGVFADKNAGDNKAVTVSGNTLSGADAGNYNLIQQSGLTANISKANLTISTSNVTKVYDALLSAAGTAVAVSGTQVFSGDSLSGGTFAFTDKNAGTNNKTVTVNTVTVNDGNSGNNYTVSYADNTTSTISKADLAVTGLTASNKTYDAGIIATLSGTAAVAALGSDVVAIGGAATGTFADKNAGDNKAVTVSGNTLSGADAANYNLIQQAGLTATISKADLAVTGLTASNKTYDAGIIATLTGTAAVAALGSDVVTIGGTASGVFADKNAGENKAVTVSGNTLSGADAANYNLIQQAGLTATISKADLAVTGLTASNKTYDAGIIATLTGTAAVAALGSDVVTIGGTASGVFADKNAGENKAVTVSGNTLSGADAANYNLIQQAGLTANISKANLAVTGLTASNKTYDAGIIATLTGTAAVAALGSDVVTIGGTASGVFADKNAGENKAVTVSGNTLSGADAANYNLIQQAGLTANISKANLAVTGLTASNKTYDAGIIATLTGTAAVAALGSDVVTIGGTASGVFADKNAGENKAVTVSGNTLSGADAANYNLIQQAGLTATISKADLAVTGLTASNKTYDAGIIATLTGTAAVAALGSDVVAIGGTASGVFADKNAGENKAVTVSGNTLSGADAANYNLIQQAGLTATISKADLAVTGLTASNKTYDAGIVATLGGTAVVAALGSDVVAIGGTASGVFADKNAGENKAFTVSGNTLSGADAANYNLIQQAGLTATISKADLAVTGLTASNKTYDAGIIATLGGTAAVAALGSDVVAIGGTASGVFADKNAGDNKAVTVSGNTLSGADAANYNLIQQSGLTASVAAKPLAANGITAANKVYDGTTAATLNTSAAALMPGGVIIGDVVTLDVASASGAFADKNVGTNKPVTISGLALGGNDASNYTVSDASGATASITDTPTLPTQPAQSPPQLPPSAPVIPAPTPIDPPPLIAGVDGTPAVTAPTDNTGITGGAGSSLVGSGSDSTGLSQAAVATESGLPLGRIDFGGAGNMVPLATEVSGNTATLVVGDSAGNSVQEEVTTGHPVFRQQGDVLTAAGGVLISERGAQWVATSSETQGQRPPSLEGGSIRLITVLLTLPNNVQSELSVGFRNDGVLVIKAPLEIRQVYDERQIMLLATVAANKRMNVDRNNVTAFVLLED